MQAIRCRHGAVHPYGATVTDWRPVASDEPVLFVSERARFEPGVPIRGGVPIVFPWFGPDPEGLGGPAHGFARRSVWAVDRVEDDEVALRLESTEETRAYWPTSFHASLLVRFDPDRLRIQFDVDNTGGDSFSFEHAFHTYFRVADVRTCTLEGLQGADYVDKVDGGRIAMHDAELLRFRGETDRVYNDTEATCVLDDGTRSIEIEKSGMRSTIVWNPWDDWSRRTADFGDDEWQSMVCVESGNVGRDAVLLRPGARHRVTLSVRVGPPHGAGEALRRVL